MPWGFAAAAVGGALISGDASKSAAQTQANASNQASQVQQNMFNTTQANAQPWIQGGQQALSQLMAGTQPGGNLTQQAYTPFTAADLNATQSPGYAFQLQQGNNALTNAASLSGGMNSNNLQGLINYNQGAANTDYQQSLANYMSQFQQGNAVNQQNFANLSNLSQTGANAGQGLGSQSATVGSQIGNNIVGAGQATASGQIGVANALTGAGSSAYNAYLQSQYLNQGNTGWDPSSVAVNPNTGTSQYYGATNGGGVQ
jgi:hypothetical protein